MDSNATFTVCPCLDVELFGLFYRFFVTVFYQFLKRMHGVDLQRVVRPRHRVKTGLSQNRLKTRGTDRVMPTYIRVEMFGCRFFKFYEKFYINPPVWFFPTPPCLLQTTSIRRLYY